MRQQVAIRFKVKCSQSQPGQVLKLVGSTAQLGMWQPANGLTLYTNEKEFPIWQAGILLDPGFDEFEYKYVLSITEANGVISANQEFVWENIDNRKLLLRNFGGQGGEVTEEFDKISTPTSLQMNQSTLDNSFESRGTIQGQMTQDQRMLANFAYYQQQANYMQQILPQHRTAPPASHAYYNQPQHAYSAPYQPQPVLIQTPFYHQTPHVQFTPIVQAPVAPLIQNPQAKQNFSPLKVQTSLPKKAVSSDPRLFTVKAEQPQKQVQTTIMDSVISKEDESSQSEDYNQVPISKLLTDMPQVKINKDDRVLIVSFKLPVQLERDDKGGLHVTKKGSIMNTTLYDLQNKNTLITAQWIGHPGIFPTTEREKLEIEQFLVPYNCVPVWLPQELHDQVFQFHERVIKPLFHNFKSLNDFEYDLGKEQLWRSYHEMNKIYCTSVTNMITAKELIWIHDTYLLLLPTLIKRKNMSLSIGFFLHSPWPPTDIFKMLPYRLEILKSMMCCELIGFHIFEYARNFYTGCQRIMGFKHEFKRGGTIEIEANGRTISLRISHVGVDIEDLKTILQQKDQLAFQKIREFKERIFAKIGQRSIVFGSYDRNSVISGVRNKLAAYLAFLDNYPRSRNQVCLIQYVTVEVCVPCLKKNCEHILEARKDTDALVQQIQTKYKGSLIYCEQDLDKLQRIALWSAINHMIDTTFRDGQSIAPMEFIAVKKIQERHSSSTVIMSEYSGCNRALGGILRINPYNVEDITKAIDAAIQLLPEEREQRMTISYKYVESHNAIKWVQFFLQNLKMTAVHQHMYAKETVIQAMGLGLQTTLIKTRVNFEELQLALTHQDFQRATNRLILINQEGVIPFIKNNPDPRALSFLDKLSQHQNTQVIVISQSMKDQVYEWYNKASMLGIAAENGFFYRFKSTGQKNEEWARLSKLTDFEWIVSVEDIMKTYCEKTEGASIERKESLIVWNYKDTDQGLGDFQAKELTNHLDHLFSYLQIEVIQGKKSLAVIPRQLKRVKFVKHMIRQFSSKKPVDFLMYIGDDLQSEQVFQHFNQLKKQPKSEALLTKEATILSCTIGRRVTQANYFLSSTDAVLNLLQKLPEAIAMTPTKNVASNLSMAQRRIKSLHDLNFSLNFKRKDPQNFMKSNSPSANSPVQAHNYDFKEQDSENQNNQRLSVKITNQEFENLDLSIEEQDEEKYEFEFLI